MGVGVTCLVLKPSKGKVQKLCSAYESDTTNNRMELTAAVRALEALKEPCQVTLVTDSHYLKHAFYRRMVRDMATKMVGALPLDNQSKTKIYGRYCSNSAISMLLLGEWVQGHAGHPEK